MLLENYREQNSRQGLGFSKLLTPNQWLEAIETTPVDPVEA